MSRSDDPTAPWPVGRGAHSSCLLAGSLVNDQYPVVVVMGGEDYYGRTLSDVWMRSEEGWKQVSLGLGIVQMEITNNELIGVSDYCKMKGDVSCF